MSDVTRILSQIDAGDPRAAEQLLPLVYDELRKLAASRLALERPGQTLQATALVHEAYLRLAGKPANRQEKTSAKKAALTSDACSTSPVAFNSRGHFFAAAAEAMRRILVEQARRRKAAKRGGGAEREELHESAIFVRPQGELLAVHEVLDRLAETDPAAATLVKLRFFVGLSMGEVADAMGISVRSAHDIWAYARSWLHQKIARESSDSVG